MTTLTRTKLTDTQLIALSGAAWRQDGTVSLPERIKGMAAQKLATSLIDKGFVRENPSQTRHAGMAARRGRPNLCSRDHEAGARDPPHRR